MSDNLRQRSLQTPPESVKYSQETFLQRAKVRKRERERGNECGVVLLAGGFEVSRADADDFYLSVGRVHFVVPSPRSFCSFDIGLRMKPLLVALIRTSQIFHHLSASSSMENLCV